MITGQTKLKDPFLLDSKADMLVFGNGERPGS